MASLRDNLREASDSVASLPSRKISTMPEGGAHLPGGITFGRTSKNSVWAKVTLASKAGGFSGCVGAPPVVVPGGPFHLFGRSAPGAEGGHHRASLSTH